MRREVKNTRPQLDETPKSAQILWEMSPVELGPRTRRKNPVRFHLYPSFDVIYMFKFAKN